MRSIGRTGSIARSGLGLVALGLFLLGCVETYIPGKTLRPKTQRLTVQHTAGGTHYRMAVNGHVWYLLFGPELLVVNPENGRVIDQQDLTGSKSHGPATDMVMHEGELWVVLKDFAVVQLSLDDPRHPWIEETITSGTLGLRPRGLAVIDDGIVVFGMGGVTDPVRGRRLVQIDDEVNSVAESPGGPVYCVGRRIHRMSDDLYVGSASALHVLHGTSPWGEDAIVFVRHERGGSLLGLMDNTLREYDSDRTTVVVPGHVTRVRFDKDQLMVLTDEEAHFYVLRNDSMQLDYAVPIRGARDAMRFSDGTLLVAGEFGRGTIKMSEFIEGSSNKFTLYTPEPAGLTKAISDGRNILATSPGGDWLYRIGHEAVQATVTDRSYPAPARTAVTLGWSAEIGEDEHQVRITTPAGSDVMVAPDGSRFTCLAASEGVLWFGHETGIIMVRLPMTLGELPGNGEDLTEEERAARGLGVLDGMTKLSVKLDGPIIFLEPLMLGGGVAYASGGGGFGVVSEELQ